MHVVLLLISSAALAFSARRRPRASPWPDAVPKLHLGIVRADAELPADFLPRVPGVAQSQHLARLRVHGTQDLLEQNLVLQSVHPGLLRTRPEEIQRLSRLDVLNGDYKQ